MGQSARNAYAALALSDGLSLMKRIPAKSKAFFDGPFSGVLALQFPGKKRLKAPLQSLQICKHRQTPVVDMGKVCFAALIDGFAFSVDGYSSDLHLLLAFCICICIRTCPEHFTCHLQELQRRPIGGTLVLAPLPDIARFEKASPTFLPVQARRSRRYKMAGRLLAAAAARCGARAGPFAIPNGPSGTVVPSRNVTVTRTGAILPKPIKVSGEGKTD